MGNLYKDISYANKKTIKEIIKLADIQTETRIICKCGHSVLVPLKKPKQFVVGVVNTYLKIKKQSLNIDFKANWQNKNIVL